MRPMRSVKAMLPTGYGVEITAGKTIEPETVMELAAWLPGVPTAGAGKPITAGLPWDVLAADLATDGGVKYFGNLAEQLFRRRG